MTGNDIPSRLDAIEARLSRIEQAIGDTARLREQLQHEIESRRALAEQTAYLLEKLGEARREVKLLQGGKG